ncbi:hypothetical protein SAMN06295967_101244 [Belliella buryatensis]|uniref:Uncharacterized protein n=1 Tax=Belliella buryatensis TaxID=1500549 RepID=A0A239AMQ0_9BACT|nr:hypothetical protein SAMN06295967_101244 [Belliella buryatensis]
MVRGVFINIRLYKNTPPTLVELMENELVWIRFGK